MPIILNSFVLLFHIDFLLSCVLPCGSMTLTSMKSTTYTHEQAHTYFFHTYTHTQTIVVAVYHHILVALKCVFVLRCYPLFSVAMQVDICLPLLSSVLSSYAGGHMSPSVVLSS